MTALVPENLDATAGRARRAGLWGGAAWRWSLLAGLGLHVALVGAWWVRAKRAEPVVLSVPMQVRLTERPALGRSAPHREAQVGESPRHEAAQAVAPNGALAAKPNLPPNVPVEVAPSGLAPPSGHTPVPALAPIHEPGTTAAATSAPVVAATVPIAATAPSPAPSNPATSTSAPGPAVAKASGAPANAAPGAPGAPGAQAISSDLANGADRNASPIEVPSSMVTYLVKPDLKFPPGSEDLGEFGSVTLRVLVDVQGGVSAVQRLKSSGYARLDQQAANVIRRARFNPHQVNGVPRAMWVTIPVNFNPP